MKITILVLALFALLALDMLIAISGMLYAGPTAGIFIIVFIIAVIAACIFQQSLVLYLLHDVALLYFLIRNISTRSFDGFPEFIGFVILINGLVWLVIRLRDGIVLST